MHMSDPTDLISEIHPSRALDAAIHTRFFGEVLSLKSGYFIDDGLPVPAYSSSIDAAVSLCTSLLPGWGWRAASNHRSDEVEIKPEFDDPEYGSALKAKFSSAESNPELALSLSPPGRPALGLLACVLAVMDGLVEDRPPFKDARELHALAPLALTPRRIKRHPGAPPVREVDNSAYGRILEQS
jgi:hypothetical protein